MKKVQFWFRYNAVLPMMVWEKVHDTQACLYITVSDPVYGIEFLATCLCFLQEHMILCRFADQTAVQLPSERRLIGEFPSSYWGQRSQCLDMSVYAVISL